jgi:hypothetical protein
MQPTLYKFMPCGSDDQIERLKRILNGHVYFSSPAHFNDPFEMTSLRAPRTVSGFDSALRDAGIENLLTSTSSKRTIYRDYLRRMQALAPKALERRWVDSLGVLCLTTEKADVLMWAHYADSHRGICVGFDSGATPFNTARAVVYSQQRAVISQDAESDDDQIIDLALLTKSLHWSYEHEWRAIKRPVSDDEKTYYKQLLTESPDALNDIADVLASEGGPGHYEFEPSAIRVVCLGAQMPDVRRNDVIEIVRQRLPNVRIERMELDQRHFQLNSSREFRKR